jgi:hypothetical protein
MRAAPAPKRRIENNAMDSRPKKNPHNLPVYGAVFTNLWRCFFYQSMVLFFYQFMALFFYQSLAMFFNQSMALFLLVFGAVFNSLWRCFFTSLWLCFFTSQWRCFLPVYDAVFYQSMALFIYESIALFFTSIWWGFEEVQLCFSESGAGLLSVYTIQSHCQSKLAAGAIYLR